MNNHKNGGKSEVLVEFFLILKQKSCQAIFLIEGEKKVKGSFTTVVNLF